MLPSSFPIKGAISGPPCSAGWTTPTALSYRPAWAAAKTQSGQFQLYELKEVCCLQKIVRKYQGGQIQELA